ncbi:MAG: hypothetical protein ACRCR2_02570 [Fusobacteriaceae bacterium]
MLILRNIRAARNSRRLWCELDGKVYTFYLGVRHSKFHRSAYDKQPIRWAEFKKYDTFPMKKGDTLDGSKTYL